VQKRGGELLWEGGDDRKVVVPEDAPAGKCRLLSSSLLDLNSNLKAT
jgi:hypothetical protein